MRIGDGEDAYSVVDLGAGLLAVVLRIGGVAGEVSLGCGSSSVSVGCWHIVSQEAPCDDCRSASFNG